MRADPFRLLALGIGLLASLASCSARHRRLRDAETDARWMLEYYVAALQESYRAAHGHFAADYSALFDPGARITSAALGRARAGLTIRVAAASVDGWSASASLSELPGSVCVLNVGNPPSVLGAPTHPGISTGGSGHVVCTGFGR